MLECTAVYHTTVVLKYPGTAVVCIFSIKYLLVLVCCKVVGTHRVLHLGSIERERVTREWASDVPCGYYGMIYLRGVYILGVHMGHKLILFFLACIA